MPSLNKEREKMARRAINVEITPRNNEPIERTIKRFLKKVKKEKIIENYRDRRYYEKPSVTRKKKQLQRKRVAQKLHADYKKKYNLDK